MADEFETHSENHFSSFWPLLILIGGLFIWAGFQDWALNNQRNMFHQQVQQLLPTVQEAKNVSDHYVALMKDLVETSQKNPAAADIVKAAIAAGLIHVQPNAAGGAAAPAPAPAPTK